MCTHLLLKSSEKLESEPITVEVDFSDGTVRETHYILVDQPFVFNISDM
jgi:hypothetical protein